MIIIIIIVISFSFFLLLLFFSGVGEWGILLIGRFQILSIVRDLISCHLARKPLFNDNSFSTASSVSVCRDLSENCIGLGQEWGTCALLNHHICGLQQLLEMNLNFHKNL